MHAIFAFIARQYLESIINLKCTLAQCDCLCAKLWANQSTAINWAFLPRQLCCSIGAAKLNSKGEIVECCWPVLLAHLIGHYRLQSIRASRQWVPKQTCQKYQSTLLWHVCSNVMGILQISDALDAHANVLILRCIEVVEEHSPRRSRTAILPR